MFNRLADSVVLGLKSCSCVAATIAIVASTRLVAEDVDGPASRTRVQTISLKHRLADVDVQQAADALLEFVTMPGPHNQYFPRFAKEKIAWLTAQVTAKTATVILLKDLAKTNLGPDDLMAATALDGRQVVIISEPRFVRFLIEGGNVSSPFGEQQTNDFMLGLIHEIVHLQGGENSRVARTQDRIREESRTWRDVSLNVVRPLRRLGQRMHQKFVRVDDALRSCDDLLPCAEFTRAVFR